MMGWQRLDTGHEECRKIMEREFEEKERLEKEKGREDRLRDRYQRASTIPFETFKSMNFDSFRTTPGNRRAIEVLNIWKPTDSWGVLLQGNPGVGKSHLLFALANKWIEQGVGFLFENVSEMFDTLRAGYDKGTYKEEMNRIQSTEVLVMDDLGSEKPSEWVEEKLFQVLDHRVMHSKPTFFTTNCKSSDLKNKLHERITSRIKDMATVVVVGGEDWRNKKYEDRLTEIEKRIAEGKK